MRSLPYYGGRSAYSVRGVGPWVAAQIPWQHDTVYVEPFAGMLGVLLQRQPVKNEIANDINDRLVNWWRCVRDYPEEFARLIAFTPVSRTECHWAWDNLDNPALPPLRRALAYHVVLDCGYTKSDGEGNGFYRELSVTSKDDRLLFGNARALALARRLESVQLDNTCALTLLERTAGLPHAVIYADPPYLTGSNTPYLHDGVSAHALADALLAQQGRVALSGNAGDWDDYLPGWHTSLYSTHRHNYLGSGVATVTPRTECLWTNYPPLQPRLL